MRYGSTSEFIVKNRERFGSVMWLFGDSIFRGFALGRYEDRFTPNQIGRQPLWPLRSPSSMLNLILADNGYLVLDQADEVFEGDLVACYAGHVGQPDRMDMALERLEQLGRARVILPGDALVFLNAGPHTADPDLYERQWLQLRAAANVFPGTTTYICETPDDVANRTGPFTGEPSDPRLYMYDLPFGVNGMGRTHNDATRSAATTDVGVTSGTTKLLPLVAPVAAWQHRIRDGINVPIYLPDGVHLNVWGQMVLVRELMHSVWPTIQVRSVLGMERAVVKGWRLARYGSADPGQWTRAMAARWVRLCFDADYPMRYFMERISPFRLPRWAKRPASRNTYRPPGAEPIATALIAPSSGSNPS